jgi:NAD(P)-dependent dehydrogenase (short-subunit alcohol dehydrogenase family)
VGKVALVTGGAGLYGRQIVAALAEAGARTYTAARHLDALEALAREHCALGHDVRALPLDQGDEASILTLRDVILQESGHIDVLVNNAVLRPMKKGYQDAAEAFAESMRVNATGIFMMTRAFADVMAGQGNGSIINVSSIYGVVAPDPANYVGTSMNAFQPDYYFHKGGIISYTRFVASYYGAHGVRCNCISPGGYWTPGGQEAFELRYNQRTMLGRLANDTDLMGVIVFLASDASAYVTAVNIPVDAGYTAK